MTPVSHIKKHGVTVIFSLTETTETPYSEKACTETVQAKTTKTNQ